MMRRRAGHDRANGQLVTEQITPHTVPWLQRRIDRIQTSDDGFKISRKLHWAVGILTVVTFSGLLATLANISSEVLSWLVLLGALLLGLVGGFLTEIADRSATRALQLRDLEE